MPKISISMSLEMPRRDSPPTYTKRCSVEEKVREALELIDSGHDSRVEWEMIIRLYRTLRNTKKKTKRMVNLIQMIEPVLEKFGYYEVVGNGN